MKRRRSAEVFLRPEEVSLAIGKSGSNIKLASMLTGYQIDVYRDAEAAYDDDIYLDEFKDEIDEWIIDSLKNMGCVTAKSVLNTPKEVLMEKADLEEENVDFVLSVLLAEYADEAADSDAPADDPQEAPEADEDAETPETELPADETAEVGDELPQGEGDGQAQETK